MSVYTVENIQKINTTYYKEGDLFLTKNVIGVMQGGKIEQLVKKSELKQLVKEEVSKQVKQVKTNEK